MRPQKAFTLIELLVVIAIIALLLAIMTPALRLAKKKGASVACMTNLKNMSLAWYTYAEENDGKIMSAEMEAMDNNRLVGWIGMPRNTNGTVMGSTEFSRTTPEVSDEHEQLGAEKGALYPYVNTTEVYHCPGDTIRKGPDGTRLYVSYCVPSCLNRNNPSVINTYITNFGRITSPGSRFCFVESGETNRGNWIAGGHFVIACPEYGDSGYGLWSPIAINHGDSSALGFVDGHAELRKWHDKDVFEHYNRTANSNVYNTFIPDQATMSDDIRFVVSGWSIRYKK